MFLGLRLVGVQKRKGKLFLPNITPAKSYSLLNSTSIITQTQRLHFYESFQMFFSGICFIRVPRNVLNCIKNLFQVNHSWNKNSCDPFCLGEITSAAASLCFILKKIVSQTRNLWNLVLQKLSSAPPRVNVSFCAIQPIPKECSVIFLLLQCR